MTEEEKDKLYQAIGYTGQETYNEYPIEVLIFIYFQNNNFYYDQILKYVNMKVKFNLNKFAVGLIDGEYRYGNKFDFFFNRRTFCFKHQLFCLNNEFKDYMDIG